jgi:hypothetical protein
MVAYAPTHSQNLLRVHHGRDQEIPQSRRQNPRIESAHQLPIHLSSLREEIRPTVLRMLLLVLRMYSRTHALKLPLQAFIAAQLT